jgi:hypothetical protein
MYVAVNKAVKTGQKSKLSEIIGELCSRRLGAAVQERSTVQWRGHCPAPAGAAGGREGRRHKAARSSTGGGEVL